MRADQASVQAAIDMFEHTCFSSNSAARRTLASEVRVATTRLLMDSAFMLEMSKRMQRYGGYGLGRAMRGGCCPLTGFVGELGCGLEMPFGLWV